jgi:hypothetical protein
VVFVVCVVVVVVTVVSWAEIPDNSAFSLVWAFIATYAAESPTPSVVSAPGVRALSLGALIATPAAAGPLGAATSGGAPLGLANAPPLCE